MFKHAVLQMVGALIQEVVQMMNVLQDKVMGRK